MDDRSEENPAGPAAVRSSLVERAAEKLMTTRGGWEGDNPALENGSAAKGPTPPSPSSEEPPCAPEERPLQEALAAGGAEAAFAPTTDDGVLAAAVAGGAAIFGKEQAADQIQRKPRIVEVDTAGLEARSIITPNTKRTRTVEEFRLIKRMVLDQRWAIRDAPGNTVLVTSALPAEGKTTTAINLAMSIAAEQGLRVLLVDADFVKPDALRQLGVSASKGLVDVLQDSEMDIADVILPTTIENLSLVPAGQPHDRCTELLASTRMKELINDLAGRYQDRILIFDSPPILATTEPVVLTSLMGQIVFVVQADRTKREMVLSALELIGERPHLGLVLNRARGRFGNTDFGSFYGSYYYGYGGQERVNRAAE